MNAEQAGAYAPLLPPRVHRGSGMKACPPEAAGGRPGLAGRSGPASFSGPSSRTKAGEAAGAGTPVSGALGAALAASLLAAATLLLAPGEARAQFCLGATTATNADVTCSAATYPVSIRSTIQSNANVTVRVPGGTGAGGTATVITGSTFYAGINLLASDQSQTGNYAIYVGTTAAVSIVDDTGSGNESPGIRIRQHGSGTATVDVRSQVTIGTSTSSRMRAHGIYVRSSGSGGAATITNAGTIYASYEGIDVQHDGAATTTVTHSGAIDSLNHGIQAVTDGAGALMVTSSGNITVTNANQQGIRMRAQKNGAMTLTATGGTITTPAQGIYMESQGTGTVTIQGTAASAPTQSGPTITSSASHGIHVHKSGSSATAGDVSITTTGGSITPATTGSFYGIYVQDHATYTGAVTIVNAADVTASRQAIFVSRLGSGAVSVTNRGGTVRSSVSSAIFAKNAASDASTVSVSIMGGTVRTEGTGVAAVWAGNNGAGDVSVAIAAGATAISRNHAGILAELGSYSGSPRMTIAQNGAILGRKGVHAWVAQHSTDDPVVARQAADQPVIDVAWTGTFSHGDDPDERAMVSQDDNGRFSVTSAANVPAIARAAQASAATGGLYDGAAGIEAQLMSWFTVVTQVAEGDDPGAIDATTQNTAVPTGATAADNDYVAQFRAVFGNQELAIAQAVFTAIDSTATSLDDLDDAEIVTYLRGNSNAVRGLLRNLLRQTLSAKEQAVLAALATGDSDGLTDALDDADAGFSNAYKTAVRALLNRYHVGNIDVAMTGGTIASRGDGIRAYYATPNANNGAISVSVAAGTTVTADRAGIWVANAGGDVTVSNSGTVTGGTYGIYAANAADNGGIEISVAADASVTGAEDGVYVANAGEGLMLAKKYTYGFSMDDGTTADDLVAVMHGEGADAVPLLDQLVTVAGTVTGGTGAAVRLNGGGAVIVERGGKVHAGSSGVGILVNDPGPALAHIDGEVKGGAGGAAAVHLTGGGSVIVGLNGKVEANGATRTIRGGGTDETMVTVTLVTDGMVVYREDAEEAHAPRMVGAYDPSSVTNVRFREDRNGVPTGYSTSLTVTTSGMLDTSRLDPRLCPGGEPRDDEGNCPSSPGDPGTGDPGTGDPGTEPGTGPGTDPDMDVPPVTMPVDVPPVIMPGAFVLRDDGDFDRQETPNDGISITVPKGVNVTARAGIKVNVENARPGLMLARKYTPGFGVGIAPGEDPGNPDELVPVMHGEGADAVPLLNQLVRVHGAVTGGTDAAVHLSGGGVLVLKGGEVRAGSSGVGILADGPALVYVDGEVKGGAGGAAAVHLKGGGDVIVGLNGKVEANGAAHAIQYPDAGSATNTLTLVTAGDVAIGLSGRVQAAGGAHATQSDGSATNTLTLVTASMYLEDAVAANARLEGSIEGIEKVRYREDDPDGVPTGYAEELPIVDGNLPGEDALREEFAPRPKSGTGSTPPTPTFSCARAGDGRCRLYEALPSVLLAMNAQPSWAERTSAARDGNGGWARVEASRGEWQAKKAETETMGGGKLAYDHRRSAVRAGVDFHAGESGRVGVSVHALRGKAEMGGVGEVELDGMGGGLSATWLAGDFYVDAQAAMTLYDVDLDSNIHGDLQKKDVYGAGYGLGMDVGRRMGVGGMMVTPRAGVEWSKVGGVAWSKKAGLDDFVDMEPAGGPRARVSVEEADSVKGRVGVMVEAEMGSGESSGRLFASVDVEQEFSDETEVKVGEELLKTEVRPTAVRVGIGGAFAVAEDVVVRGTAGFRTSGSGTSGYGGGLELQMRF